MQRVHNGHVRQGWILLINPTGYIVPSARTDIPSLRFSTPPPRRARRFVPEAKTRRAAPVCASVSSSRSSRPSILRFSARERAVSFCRDELCRRRARRSGALVCVVIISLSLCALAPKAVLRLLYCRPASARSPVFLRLEKDAAMPRRGGETERDRAGLSRRHPPPSPPAPRGDYRETITALSIPRRWW